ncbi:hypothetical protein AVEN_113729-1 [Araneus ventricosus]|uniref:Uncharacterized protein n=1 Tax=Araneus ventricosus TaxID=182803 RepID=A0A4Y2RML4_ARAVE|nr:hypothetical protein AVEN_113729-1 [Araneus ventricosus]
MDLFIELKNEFTSFRHDIYNKVDGFSKLLTPSTDKIQSDEPLSPVSPSLQRKFSKPNYVASVDHDVILITETWLCEDIDSLELFDDRYLVFRKDRGSSSNSCRRGGGVVIAVKKCFSCTLDLPESDLDAVWISIKLNHR